MARPRIAHRRAGGAIENVSADEVRVGDLLLVAPGEMVPVDGRMGSDPALLDESVLTDESAHVERGPGDTVRSGVVNAGTAFELVADARTQESTYAGIVRLAEQAGAERAPVVRLADRYATWFLPLALLLAGAGWLMTGSPVGAVAVLVVTTPCPLLLAVPVAIGSGMSRAFRARGDHSRRHGAGEPRPRTTTAVTDKTGTLTAGHPAVLNASSTQRRSTPRRYSGWPPRWTRPPLTFSPRPSSRTLADFGPCCHRRATHRNSRAAG